jgi:hypothetical protein
MRRLRFLSLALILLAPLPALAQKNYSEILIERDAHPAVRAAAERIAKSLAIPADHIVGVDRVSRPRSGQIVLASAAGSESEKALAPKLTNPIKNDGYVIVERQGGALIYGARPRSLLFAAGDVALWTKPAAYTSTGEFLRNPDFAIRTGEFDPSRSVTDFVAELGVNAVIMRREATGISMKDTLPEVYRRLNPDLQSRLERQHAQALQENLEFVRKCHDADVTVYAFLYGNDPAVWSPALYQAAIQAFPSAKGVDVPNSHEKNSMSPADPNTWKFFRAYITELMNVTGADGLYATFWDRYGIYCEEERCRAAGLDKFSNQLYECVKQYYEATHALGKKLVVRTWASGSPHWLRDNYVHAPGYGAFGGTEEQLWGRVIRELPPDMILQTKVYYSDCEPDARLSPLIGHTAPHPQIVEYQVSGQFVGRFYFPASSVQEMATTMRQAREEVGEGGGVNIFPGGTMQSNYSVFDDIINSVNLYAWRRLSWDTHTDVNRIWTDWAATIYSQAAAPHIVKALQLSEHVVDGTFTTLGFGSSTNSDFAGTIARRETLLRYTNRYYLPMDAQRLEPTKGNIDRVVEEKRKVVEQLNLMQAELDLAKPALMPAQAAEWQTRFDWLKEFAIVNNQLDESLWRYRYLRYLDSMLTTDPSQLKSLAASYDIVEQHAKLLFRYSPDQKFSCYSTTLGELARKPSLGSPLPLMHELYAKSKELIEQSVGPDYLPAGVIRGEARPKPASGAEQ